MKFHKKEEKSKENQKQKANNQPTYKNYSNIVNVTYINIT